MEIVFVIAFVAVVVVGSWAWGKVTQAGWRKVNQTLSRKTYQEGEHLVAHPLYFRSAAGAQHLVHALVTGLALPAQPGALTPSLYLAGHSDQQVAVNFGSRLSPRSFESVVSLDQAVGAGDWNSCAVVRWTRLDGVVVGVGEIRHLRERVRAIILALDPGAQFAEQPAS